MKHFDGDTDAMDPVSSTLRSLNTRKMKEGDEIENMCARQRGLAPARDAVDSQDIGALPADFAPPASKGKGKAVPKKGRRPGLGAPTG